MSIWTILTLTFSNLFSQGTSGKVGPEGLAGEPGHPGLPGLPGIGNPGLPVSSVCPGILSYLSVPSSVQESDRCFKNSRASQLSDALCTGQGGAGFGRQWPAIWMQLLCQEESVCYL